MEKKISTGSRRIGWLNAGKVAGILLAVFITCPFIYLSYLVPADAPTWVFASLFLGWFINLQLGLFISSRSERLLNEQVLLSQRLRKTMDSAHTFLLDSIIELRRPLQGLTGIRDLYGLNTPSPETKEYMDVVDHCSNHLLSQLDRLQFFSEVSLRSMPKKEIKFNIKELLTGAITKSTERLVGRSATVVKSIDSNLPEEATGPANWIEPMLVELLDCALRVSGSGKISVSAARDSLSPHLTVITLKDDVGFSDKALRDIVNEITGDPKASPWSGKALGLSVPILRSLISAMNARLWIQGQESASMSIHLSFPLVMEPVKVQTSSASSNITSHFHLPSDKILVVDDDPLVRNILSSLLHRLGQNVTVATNGHEAIELCRRHLYGVVFIDMDMPVLDGWAAAETILNKLHLPHPPKVIAVTSHTREQDHERGKKIGMHSYLNKPASAAELIAILEGLGLKTSKPTIAASSTPKHDADVELKSAYTVDFNKMYQFYSEDFNLCRQVLTQAQITLSEFSVKIEKAVVLGDLRGVRHALHQMKGEFAICMCTPGVSLTERMMSYEQINSLDFLNDFEELNKLVERVRREIDELKKTQLSAA